MGPLNALDLENSNAKVSRSNSWESVHGLRESGNYVPVLRSLEVRVHNKFMKQKVILPMTKALK